MPADYEYERREVALAHKQIDEVNTAPLADRKEAQADFFEVMRDSPNLVAERIGWLLGGSYGYGSMVLAKRVLASPRMNREAALTQMVGVFEWQCPETMTRQAWKRLTGPEKARLASAVATEIEEAEKTD